MQACEPVDLCPSFADVHQNGEQILVLLRAAFIVVLAGLSDDKGRIVGFEEVCLADFLEFAEDVFLLDDLLEVDDVQFLCERPVPVSCCQPLRFPGGLLSCCRTGKTPVRS